MVDKPWQIWNEQQQKQPADHSRSNVTGCDTERSVIAPAAQLAERHGSVARVYGGVPYQLSYNLLLGQPRERLVVTNARHDIEFHGYAFTADILN